MFFKLCQSLSKHIQTLEQEIVHLRAGLVSLSFQSKVLKTLLSAFWLHNTYVRLSFQSKVSSESSEHQIVDDEGADAQGSLKVCFAAICFVL